ncbi:hypothetical protein [Simplicispira metamorpha]|uniref:Uncharacterized protein n=1 Tax=Simplicispira metamorpha TaxID=80881 RepID=A0A4R2N555_9BURK|nr:hypothetical protein [Simplicispira metamorpha]TCP15935.1 hypothetical protein EV674_1226 [Simplicispira metamorpha]
MSTKATLKSRLRVDGQPGFHLYDDVLTEMAYELAEESGSTSTPAPPVYLTLEGVEVELRTLPSGGAAVTLTIPRDMARELGLVPPENRELE